MDEKQKEQAMLEAKIELELEGKISVAIAQVLQEYGVSGKYIFNVGRDADYGHEPIRELKGQKLSFPRWCLASGGATVEDPGKIIPL